MIVSASQSVELRFQPLHFFGRLEEHEDSASDLAPTCLPFRTLVTPQLIRVTVSGRERFPCKPSGALDPVVFDGHFPPPFGFGLQDGQSVEQLSHFIVFILFLESLQNF